MKRACAASTATIGVLPRFHRSRHQCRLLHVRQEVAQKNLDTFSGSRVHNGSRVPVASAGAPRPNDRASDLGRRGVYRRACSLYHPMSDRPPGSVYLTIVLFRFALGGHAATNAPRYGPPGAVVKGTQRLLIPTRVGDAPRCPLLSLYTPALDVKPTVSTAFTFVGTGTRSPPA